MATVNPNEKRHILRRVRISLGLNAYAPIDDPSTAQHIYIFIGTILGPIPLFSFPPDGLGLSTV